MDIREYRSLLAERAALKDIIARAPENSAITRTSFETRLRKVDAKLKPHKEYSQRISRAKLTFGGKPVQPNYGIDAEFAANALSQFAKAVSVTAAAGNSANGSVPVHQDCRLLITDTAQEPFGFHIEGASPTAFDEPSPVGIAIGRVKWILEAAANADDGLADLLDETDARILQAIRNFLKVVADSEAICALEFQGDVFRFQNAKQVRNSMDRLSDDKIRQPPANTQTKTQPPRN